MSIIGKNPIKKSIDSFYLPQAKKIIYYTQ